MSNEEKERRANIVANEYEEIFPQFEAFYLQSILYAADASNTAFERFASLVINDGDAFDVVSAIQEALTHAAALSRFFWPVRKSKISRSRGEKLRRAFNMSGSALEQRSLRNALEHFDERLDDFLLGDPVGYFFPGPMVEPHSLADEAVGQIFRLVDPYEFKVVILGEKHDFLGTREEVYRVLGLAKQFDRQGSQLPR